MLGEALATKATPDFKFKRIVGLISDTHIPKRAIHIPKKVFDIFEKVDFIIHAGDLVDISVIDELERIAPVLAVQGNMDNSEIVRSLPLLNSLKVMDWKIGVMHDPHILNGFGQIRELSQQKAFDVFVYGHTHEASIKWEGKNLFINPGSAIEPASPFQKPSVGILKIASEKITPELVEL